ncbi:MAG: hypothetical protein V7K69_27080 [Nostoc sp.]|uniref:hypothetical protein n=1 Tax=Nostoc sp. TaxID=1180 RepID=UPI002FFD1DCD
MPSTFFVETAIYRVSLTYQSFRRDKLRLYMRAFWLIPSFVDWVQRSRKPT